MRKIKNSFFRFFSENSRIKRTCISVVALIIALVISVSSVSAWIETISTIKVTGSGIIDTKLKTAAVVDTTSTQSIDLTKYFREAGNVHLSEASSADGKSFYFPVVQSSNGSSGSKYRLGTVNDENVNYIKFSLNVSSPDAKPYEYILSKVPVIKIGGQTVTNSTVRVAIIDETAKTTALMSMVNTTTAVPAAADGTTSATSVKSFSHYKTNKIFTIDNNKTHKITVILWLQDMNTDSYPVSGNTVEVSDFVIEPSITKYNIKAVAVTNGTSESEKGGTVKVGSATAGATSQEGVADGGSVKLTATAKSGYKFTGWYTAATGGSKKTSNSSFTLTSVTSAQTYYARFVTAYTVNAYAVSDEVYPNSKGGTVVVGSNTTASSTSTATIASGSSTTFKATKKSGYDFLGWFDSPTATTAKSTSLEYTVTITADTTLYAKFVSLYTIEAHAVTDGVVDSSTGGTVKLNAGAASSHATATVRKGSTATFVAAAKEGYAFEGWFADSTGGTALSTDTTYKITNVSSTHTVYARYKIQARKLYFVPGSNWSKDGARFAAYVWSSGVEAKWYSMSDGDGDGIYSAAVDPTCTMVIFVRMNGSNTTNNWDNKWNQTGDLTIPTDGKNKYTKNNNNWDGDTSGTWSTY